jgi:metal-responsive CopG/Arc/MetJ family transcriptional regulator
MSSVKTAISIHESLFKKAEVLAQKLSLSRSQLFSMALESFINKYENNQLFQQINAAYEIEPNLAEQEYQERMKDYQQQRMRDEW